MSIKKMGARGIYWCSFYSAPGVPTWGQKMGSEDGVKSQYCSDK